LTAYRVKIKRIRWRNRYFKLFGRVDEKKADLVTARKGGVLGKTYINFPLFETEKVY